MLWVKRGLWKCVSPKVSEARIELAACESLYFLHGIQLVYAGLPCCRRVTSETLLHNTEVHASRIEMRCREYRMLCFSGRREGKASKAEAHA